MIRYVPDNPLIVQGDHTLLLEVLNPRHDEARDALLAFAEQVKSPEYVHTWRITPLSLWNAAAAGHSADDVVEVLHRYAKFPVPDNIPAWVRGKMGRYGRLRLMRDGEWLVLEADEDHLFDEIQHLKPTRDLLGEAHGPRGWRISANRRGELKQVLCAAGHPVEDLAGYDDGDPLRMGLRPGSVALRDYQVAAVDAFLDGAGGGSGVVVLPCGAGKTLVGIAAMVRLGMRTLVLCTGHTALAQWRQQILEHTTLTDDDVGTWTAEVKELRPVTLTTYQLLTWRRRKGDAPAHFRLFHESNWGLVIYDEVHLLPAPIFRETALLQARRRLGLTATLVREDGHEADVFSLVGPKRFDLPWKELEHQGWIAQARCVEVRVPLTDEDRTRYTRATARVRARIAATAARKGPVLASLLERHHGEQVLVLGTWLEQLSWFARRYGFPVVQGETPNAERDVLFEDFRSGRLRVLGLSRVGNFAVDLPGASVAIQISGTFGSRQEEAQRLGRVLRPKPGDNTAVFYTLVSNDTVEQEFAERRQLFLSEQGYPYRLELAF